MTRTVGVEEELFLIDPSTRRLTSVSEEVIKASRTTVPGELALQHELFLQQVETKTSPHTDLDGLQAELRQLRHHTAEAAAKADASIVAAGTPILADVNGSMTRDDRYAEMMDRYGRVGRQALVCATHVHVAVDGDDAIKVIDAIGPWLPVVLALSTNSPIDHGVDTGFASWRAQIWDAWPSAGPVEPFGDRAQYDRSVRQLIESGAAIDEAMVYFDVRVAKNYPTVEVRVADVCTDVRDTVVLAGVIRALVETAVTTDAPAPQWRVEMLRSARWRARRHGLTDALVNPRDGSLVPASKAAEALLAHVSAALDAGDAGDQVRDGVSRLVRQGTGSEHQRRVLADRGMEAVVDDLIERTSR